MLLTPIARSQTFEKTIDSLELAVKTSTNIEHQVKLHMQLCWTLRNRNPERAMFHGNSALATIQENDLEQYTAQTLNYLGVVHRNKGDYNYALELYKQALEWATKTNDKIQIAYSYNNIGGIYTLTNSYPEAIEAIEKARKLFEETNQTAGIGYASINLGNLYRHIKNFKESMFYFDIAEGIKKQLNDTIGLSIVKNLKADILREQGKTAEAEVLMHELVLEYKHNKDIKGLAIILDVLGEIELERNNIEKAIELFQESETINKSIDNKQGLIYNNINLGLCNLRNNKFAIAFKKIEYGHNLAKNLGDKRSLLLSNRAFVEFYEKQGKWKEANEAQKEYVKFYSQLYNVQQSEQINSIRDKYVNEKRYIEQELTNEKNKQIEQKKAFAKAKSWFIKLGILGVLVVFIIILLLSHSYRKKAKESKLNTNLLREKNAALSDANKTKEKFLSIIGHDLKNPFNSVLGLSNLIIDQWESLDEEERFHITNEINNSSQTIYELLDNLLIWSRTQTTKTVCIPEKYDLNEGIKQLFEIFRNQANFKNINVRLEIKGEKIVYADPNMIGTVIRNLISNALKFTQNGGQIVIRTQQKVDMVEFSISDNGKGILPDDLKRIFEDQGHHTTKGTSNETGSGLGLLLAKDFIQRNNGIIWVESKPGKGSLFTFTLPLT